MMTRCKHVQTFAHQISRQTDANTPPEYSRVGQLSLKTLAQGVIQVDQVACLHIVDLNLAYYFIEYVPTSSAQVAQVHAPDRHEQTDGYLNFPLVDVDELFGSDVDPELQILMGEEK